MGSQQQFHFQLLLVDLLPEYYRETISFRDGQFKLITSSTILPNRIKFFPSQYFIETTSAER